MRAYQHQIVNGRKTVAPEVHHRNKIRSDNRPQNLEHLSLDEHKARHHGRWWGTAATLYRQGLGTYRIAKRVGVDPATVYRALVAMGVPTRKQYGGKYSKGSRIVEVPDHESTHTGRS